MTAERIVDIILEGPDDEAAEFFSQHLLTNPSFVFTGPHSWKPFRSEVGDNEVSQGERFYGPNDKETYAELILWQHPTGLWYFRTGVQWQKAPHSREYMEVGPHDIYASNPEQKMELLTAIQDFIPYVRSQMDSQTAPMINGGRLHRILASLHQQAFGSMYGWQP